MGQGTCAVPRSCQPHTCAALGEVTAVLYWTQAALLHFAERGSQVLELDWQDPAGRSERELAELLPNSMISWAHWPQITATVGKWNLQVHLGGVLLASRPFHLCSANFTATCGKGIAERYFGLHVV